ncbi:MAG: hypothetical protein ABW278_16010 [Steroidobacteraceae bacterium]
MFRLQLLLSAAGLTAALVGTSVTQAAATDPAAEEGWAAVKRCAQQETERAAHDCLDQVLRDAGVLTPAMRERQQQRVFGLSPSATAPAVAKPPPVVADAPVKPVAGASPDRVEVQIAAVSRAADGKLIITTNEGAVWRQAEGLENPRLPGIGEHMSIRKGSLGSYLCTLPSKLSWRCTRSR